MDKQDYLLIFDAFGFKEKTHQHKDILRFDYNSFRAEWHATVYLKSNSVVFVDRLQRPQTYRDITKDSLINKLKMLDYGK